MRFCSFLLRIVCLRSRFSDLPLLSLPVPRNFQRLEPYFSLLSVQRVPVRTSDRPAVFFVSQNVMAHRQHLHVRGGGSHILLRAGYQPFQLGAGVPNTILVGRYHSSRSCEKNDMRCARSTPMRLLIFWTRVVWTSSR